MMWRNQTGGTSFVTTYTHIAAKLSTVCKLNLITQTLLKFAHRCPQPEHSNQQNSVELPVERKTAHCTKNCHLESARPNPSEDLIYNQPLPIVALFFALGVLIKSSSLLLISSSVVKTANVCVKSLQLKLEIHLRLEMHARSWTHAQHSTIVCKRKPAVCNLELSSGYFMPGLRLLFTPSREVG